MLIKIDRHEIVDSKYGPKVQIFFEYKEEWVDIIKGLPWDKTHRLWNGETWEIDYNPRSISLLRPLVLQLPAELEKLVTATNRGDITVFVSNGEARIINDVAIPVKVINKLTEAMAVHPPGESEPVHLFDPLLCSFPMFLLQDAVKILGLAGYKIRVRTSM